MDFLDQDQNKPESETSQRETTLPDYYKQPEILTEAVPHLASRLESCVRGVLIASPVCWRKLLHPQELHTAGTPLFNLLVEQSSGVWGGARLPGPRSRARRLQLVVSVHCNDSEGSFYC